MGTRTRRAAKHSDVTDADIAEASLGLPSLEDDAEALRALGGRRPREEWAGRGNCVGVGLKPFFPQKGSTGAEAVAQYCVACPVRVECLAAGTDASKRPGIWGGRGTRHRRAILALLTASSDAPDASSVPDDRPAEQLSLIDLFTSPPA